MEIIIQYLIYFHAGAGAIALLAGLMALTVKKGKRNHKKSGITFYYAMIVSGLSAMLIAILPNHESPFLFAIGIFSLYFVLAGYRALRFKQENPVIIDKTISWIMIVSGFAMIVLPILLEQNIHIVLVVFGILSIGFASRELMLFRKPELLRKNWLKLHLGKMIGGYISATTAFVVVNQFLPGIYAWFVPGVIGGFYIAFWMRKINKRSI